MGIGIAVVIAIAIVWVNADIIKESWNRQFRQKIGKM